MTEPNTPKRRRGGWEYWTTVTYRSVILIIVAALIAALALGVFFWRDSFQNVLAKLADRAGEGSGVQENAEARFINLDGAVRVKKHDAVQWTNADYSTALESGDTVQTGANGIARIRFVDGTIYVVKPDTLIVVEEHARLQNKSTKVAVQVTSGAVDLSTATWEARGSSSEVRFENAVARVNENSRAAIRQDPKAKIHQITVSEGSAQLAKGDEVIRVGPYERAGFREPDDALRKEKVIAPPQLTRPRNLEPIISPNAPQEVIHFQWDPVEKAARYNLRVSTSPLFTNLIVDRQMEGTSFRARGLRTGDYYWTVSAISAQGEESQPSEANSFSLHEQPATDELLLEVESIVQHGRVIEIIGRTEPGTHVTINAEPVAYVGPDGRFRHFTRPLPSAGPHTVTIVAQNRRGEVVTRKKTVYVQ